MKCLCKTVAGSRQHGTNKPESDYDERFVFLYDDYRTLIGINAYEQSVITNKTEMIDCVGYELRKFLGILKTSSFVHIEMLYSDEFLLLDPKFKELVIDQRHRFVNVEKLKLSFESYFRRKLNISSVMADTLVNRTGKGATLTSKYGYDPREVVHTIRLGFCAKMFLETGIYPIKVEKYDKQVHELIMRVKQHPEDFNASNAKAFAEEALNGLVNTKINYTFDEQYANQVALEFYGPLINKAYAENSIRKDEGSSRIREDNTSTKLAGENTKFR